MTLEQMLAAIVPRFAGFDLQWRRWAGDPEWPKPWKCEIITNKNERAAYRIKTFGDTPEEACGLLMQRIAEVDGGAR